MPTDLYVGLWMNSYRRTPVELGLATEHDLAQMERARQAVFIYETARQTRDPKQLTNLTRGQLLLLQQIQALERKFKPRPPATARRTLVRRRRAAQPSD
jgi:hypothetical protein